MLASFQLSTCTKNRTRINTAGEHDETKAHGVKVTLIQIKQIWRSLYDQHRTILQVKLASYRQVLRILKETHATQCMHPRGSPGTSLVYP